MASSQAARQQVVTLPTEGSNPSSPATFAWSPKSPLGDLTHRFDFEAPVEHRVTPLLDRTSTTLLDPAICPKCGKNGLYCGCKLVDHNPKVEDDPYMVYGDKTEEIYAERAIQEWRAKRLPPKLLVNTLALAKARRWNKEKRQRNSAFVESLDLESVIRREVDRVYGPEPKPKALSFWRVFWNWLVKS